jgi:exopolyphosphatase/guanosine-5'-triphosphate,3'-diphosphate pyrophosphatase
LILGAIHISERVTSLWVADVGGDDSRMLINRSSPISAELHNLGRLTALLTAELEAARDVGAVNIEVTASRSLRGTRLLRLLDRVARASGAGGVQLPGSVASLAADFLAVTRPRTTVLDGPVAVARIGEGSTGVAVGAPGRPPEWVGSRPLGAAVLASRARFTDPPHPDQVEAAVNGAMRAVGSLALPAFSRLFLATPVWAMLQRLCGPRIEADAARRGVDSILGQTADDIASWLVGEPWQARLLPATAVLTLALADLTGASVEPCPADPVAGRVWLAGEHLLASGARGTV